MHFRPVCRQGLCLTTGVKMHLVTSKTFDLTRVPNAPQQRLWTFWLKSPPRGGSKPQLASQLAQTAFASSFPTFWRLLSAGSRSALVWRKHLAENCGADTQWCKNRFRGSDAEAHCSQKLSRDVARQSPRKPRWCVPFRDGRRCGTWNPKW